MNEPVQVIDVRQFLTRHLVEVFETMLSLRAVPVADHDLPLNVERVTGSVGFGGETVNGVVYLHLSALFARQTAAAMLGLTPEETPAEDEVNDVVGEVTNIITGGFKSALCDAGAPCAVSTPAIIRGISFVIEPMPGLDRVWQAFECGKDRVVVEVHIKFN